MSLSVADLNALVALGAPVLCVDTCLVLDVIRDITRETARADDAIAAKALLAAARGGSALAVLMADQVAIELAANLANVQEEAEKALNKFKAQARRIHEVAAVFGAGGMLHTNHLDGHVGRARAILDQWRMTARKLPSNPGVAGRAFTRVNAPRTPARKGKESMKDCVVVESYLEAAQQLRSAGFLLPIVFASSNTKEYHALGTSRLQADIAADFAAVSMEFAPNFGAARHSLGL